MTGAVVPIIPAGAALDRKSGAVISPILDAHYTPSACASQTAAGGVCVIKSPGGIIDLPGAETLVVLSC